MCPSKKFYFNAPLQNSASFCIQIPPTPEDTNSLSASKEISLLIWNPDIYWLLLTNSSVSPIMCQTKPVHNQCIPLKPVFIHLLRFHIRQSSGGGRNPSVFLTQLFHPFGSSGSTNRGSNPDRRTIFFSSPNRPEQLCSYTVSYSVFTWNFFPGSKVTGA